MDLISSIEGIFLPSLHLQMGRVLVGVVDNNILNIQIKSLERSGHRKPDGDDVLILALPQLPIPKLLLPSPLTFPSLVPGRLNRLGNVQIVAAIATSFCRISVACS